MKSDYTIDRVSKSEAAELLLRFHYLKDISKGFKSGYNIIQTAGAGAGGGNGGSGANGGGGGSTSSGGGGGSGYTDGSVTVVNTQLGGSSSTPKVILRYVS